VVFFAGVALVSGLVVNKRQSKQMLELETSLSKQREKTALAEKATLDLQRLISEPRTFDRQKANEILDWGGRGSVKIWYSMIGDEPSKLASQLWELLDTHGWKVLSVKEAIPIAGRPGIVIRGYADNKETFTDWAGLPEPAKTLHRLLVEAVVGNRMVETQFSPDREKGDLDVTIQGKY
jgi:hypothetical protein